MEAVRTPSIPVNNCCGCTACYCSCPTSAIRMEPDREGFLYPHVDPERCCGCGKCEQACPVLNPPELPAEYEAGVIAQSRDPEVLSESTSGGFVDALCRFVAEQPNGYVAGVAFDDAFLPKHMIADSYGQAKAFRNSKYAQSNLGKVFCHVRKLLDEGNTVLFVGTPCQAAGLKTFLKRDYEGLITVDLVCRSVPSPKLWREYLTWQEKRHHAGIRSVSCRKKTYGYHSGALEIRFGNGKRYVGSNRVDYYMKSFHADICSRPSCYHCSFKTQHRCSDFTVFDSWRPHLATEPAIEDNDRGYSNVLVHTPKGKEMLAGLKEISLYDSDPEKMLSVMGSMLAAPIRMKPEREHFYEDLERYGFEKTVKRYRKVTVKDRTIEALKPLRYGLRQWASRRRKR